MLEAVERRAPVIVVGNDFTVDDGFGRSLSHARTISGKWA